MLWISEREGAKRLQVGRPKFRRVALAAGVRRQALPGVDHVRYSAEDVDRIIRESVIEPGQAAKVAS